MTAHVPGWRAMIVLLVLVTMACGSRRKAVEANNRAFSLLANKRYADAIKEFERGIALDPGVAELHLGLGRAYEETAHYQKAEKSFRRYIQLRPEDADGHFYLGVVLEAQERIQEAAEAFQAAASRPSTGRKHLAYFRLGAMQARLGKVNEAAEAYRQSAKTDPTFLRAYENLALLYADHGDLASAEQALLNAVSTQIRDAHIRASLGLVYSKMADRIREEGARNAQLERAAAQFQEATRIRPAYARAYWNLGMTLAKITQGGSPSRRKDAVHYLQLFLSRHGKDDELSARANEMISALTRE
jgi:protein O-GlcNAc transferase